MMIATLEALAILFALKAFYGETPQANRTTVQILTTWTDKRGNGALLNRLTVHEDSDLHRPYGARAPYDREMGQNSTGELDIPDCELVKQIL